MFDKLGSKRFALPFGMVLVFGLLFSLMLYPMAHMQVKDLPFGILSLDEGSATPMGEVNAGALIVQSLAGEGEAAAPAVSALANASEALAQSPVVWNAYTSQSELDAAFDESAIYGALVIPADFTAKQAALTTGLSDEAPTVEAYLDMSKSPMVTSLMQSNISTMLEAMGVNASVTVLNPGASQGSNAFASIMSQNFLIMPLMTLSCALAMVSTILFAPAAGTSRKERYLGVAKQAAFLVVLSCALAAVLLAIARLAMGIETGLGAIFGFCWIAAFGVIALVLGFANIALPLGALVALCVLSGMACGIFAPEMLPAFWQDWIYPWAPQHFVGDGLRAIMYRGAGAFNEACVPLAITALAGLAALCASPLVPSGNRK